MQARRQPGSAFKPIVYSVALEKGSYSPATIIVDEPIVVDFDKDDVGWEPRNAGGDFLGPLSLRRALELSRNICTIKILMDVTFDPVIEMAQRMGITSELGRNLSLSLGTSELSLIELVSAYTVFPNSGIHMQPVLVKRVEDRFGNILEDNRNVPLLDESEIPTPTPREEFAEEESVRQVAHPSPTNQKQSAAPAAVAGNQPKARDESTQAREDVETEQGNGRVRAAMSPQTAYIMTSLLHGGVEWGTGSRMKQYVKRKDLAGKTGTTNKAADTWFIGFNPEYTAGAWVGFDEKRPLGGREEGARAALPIWGYFMKEVLANKPERDFPVPPEVTFKDMLTFAGSPSQGFVPKMVREPVYTPFVGKTLVLSPLDTPQTLAQYRGIVLPGTSYDQAPGQAPIGRPAPLYPGQAPEAAPLNPMDGRNLFPEATAPKPAPSRAPSPRIQENTGQQPGRQSGLNPSAASPQVVPYGQTLPPSQEMRPRPAPSQPPVAPGPR
jgi:penicillin-binding protein 1A